jgi:hypothetical protein
MHQALNYNQETKVIHDETKSGRKRGDDSCTYIVT